MVVFGFCAFICTQYVARCNTSCECNNASVSEYRVELCKKLCSTESEHTRLELSAPSTGRSTPLLSWKYDWSIAVMLMDATASGKSAGHSKGSTWNPVRKWCKCCNPITPAPRKSVAGSLP